MIRSVKKKLYHLIFTGSCAGYYNGNPTMPVIYGIVGSDQKVAAKQIPRELEGLSPNCYI